MTNPRVVTPGIETRSPDDKYPDAGVWARIDWLRMTAHEDRLDVLLELLHDRFGRHDRTTRGAKYFTAGVEWEPGIQVSHGHSASRCMVDFRGERLAIMQPGEAVELARELWSLDFKPTRIDLAIDYVMQDLSLYDHAVASCERGELCRLRSYSPNPKKQANGFVLRKLLGLGNRESSACARIYDKGLEQGIGIAGLWERIETEFKEERAPVVVAEILEAGADWHIPLANLALGAFDFRVQNGRSELDRRPRVEWWARVLEQLTPKKAKAEKPPKSFEKWANALRHSYGRRITQLAQAADVSVGELCEWLLNGVEPALERPELAREFALAFRR